MFSNSEINTKLTNLEQQFKDICQNLDEETVVTKTFYVSIVRAYNKFANYYPLYKKEMNMPVLEFNNYLVTEDGSKSFLLYIDDFISNNDQVNINNLMEVKDWQDFLNEMIKYFDIVFNLKERILEIKENNNKHTYNIIIKDIVDNIGCVDSLLFYNTYAEDNEFNTIDFFSVSDFGLIRNTGGDICSLLSYFMPANNNHNYDNMDVGDKIIFDFADDLYKNISEQKYSQLHSKILESIISSIYRIKTISNAIENNDLVFKIEEIKKSDQNDDGIINYLCRDLISKIGNKERIILFNQMIVKEGYFKNNDMVDNSVYAVNNEPININNNTSEHDIIMLLTPDNIIKHIINNMCNNTTDTTINVLIETVNHYYKTYVEKEE